MINFPSLAIEEKISTPSIYIPSDTFYFNEWSKIFIISIKKYVPWINVHCHIFDPTDQDIAWCKKYNVTVSSETTPQEFNTIDRKKGYWVCTRFYRIPEIFSNDVSVLALDSDCLFTKPLTEKEFTKDLSQDWVAIREKGSGCLGGSVGLSAHGSARHLIREEIEKYDVLKWYLDQTILNHFLNKGSLIPFSMKYIDYHFRSESMIWAGKGNRRHKKKRGRFGFPELVESYKEILIRDYS